MMNDMEIQTRATLFSMKGLISDPSEDHGPTMSGVLWFLFFFSGFFMALRLYVRIAHGKLWWDDALLVSSWLSMLAQVILVQLAVNLGYGKHLLDLPFSSLEPIMYYGASALSCSVLAINLAKISFAVTLIPLTEGKIRWFVWFAIFTLVGVGVPTIVIPWVQCRPLIKTFVDAVPGECIDKQKSVYFGMFQAVWAAAMDFSLAMLPWKIIWNLNMRKVEKIGVGIAMSLGLLAGATAIVRSLYIQQLTKSDISYDAIDSTIWSTTESAATIIAASIPILRKFLKDKVTSAVQYYGNYRSGGSKDKSKSGGSKDKSQSGGNTQSSRSRAETIGGSKGETTIRMSKISAKQDRKGSTASHWYDVNVDDSESGKSILGADGRASVLGTTSPSIHDTSPV